jgi:5-methylcytosine-specific restriction protein A
MAGQQPWVKWYKTKRWQDLRLQTFTRDLFQCRMCGRIEGNTSKLACDHIKPHGGDPVLFWDPANLQTLCIDPCHDTLKRREEQATRHQRGVWH